MSLDDEDSYFSDLKYLFYGSHEQWVLRMIHGHVVKLGKELFAL